MEKHIYNAASADKEYKDLLSESRTGISYSGEEIAHLDQSISPLIRKEQSINHLCVNNKDSIMVSERTIYRLVDYHLFSARNIDLVRKVKYSRRKKKKEFKVDKACRINSTYPDYLDVLPKGTSFNDLTQADISLFMDHINSYTRESLGNKCPYDVF